MDEVLFENSTVSLHFASQLHRDDEDNHEKATIWICSPKIIDLKQICNDTKMDVSNVTQS